MQMHIFAGFGGRPDSLASNERTILFVVLESVLFAECSLPMPLTIVVVVVAVAAAAAAAMVPAFAKNIYKTINACIRSSE